MLETTFAYAKFRSILELVRQDTIAVKGQTLKRYICLTNGAALTFGAKEEDVTKFGKMLRDSQKNF